MPLPQTVLACSWRFFSSWNSCILSIIVTRYYSNLVVLVNHSVTTCLT